MSSSRRSTISSSTGNCDRHRAVPKQHYTISSRETLVSPVLHIPAGAQSAFETPGMKIANKTIALAFLCLIALHGSVQASRMGSARRLSQVSGGLGDPSLLHSNPLECDSISLAWGCPGLPLTNNESKTLSLTCVFTVIHNLVQGEFMQTQGAALWRSTR